MIRLIVVLTLVAAALARPQVLHGLTFSPVPAAAPTAQYTLPAALGTTSHQAAAVAVPSVPPTNFVQGTAADGSNVFGYQTIDGQSRQESVGADGSVRGSYSYIDPNGQPVTINYVADQQGFRTSVDPVAAGGAAARPAAPAPAAPAPALQPATFQTVPTVQQTGFPAFTFPGFAAVTPAPAAPAPAPAPQAFTSFYSPLPATTLPLSHITQSPASTGLSHFGFQPVAVQQQQPAIAAQPAQPIAYSFNTGR